MEGFENGVTRRGISRREFLNLAGAAGLAALSGGLLSACSSEAAPAASSSAGSAMRTITDMAGKQVSIPASIGKYADGWFAHAEVDIMLNKAKGLVATHCSEKTQPWMYKVCSNMKGAVSTFGDGFNFEEVVDLGPQIVFDSNNNLRDKCDEVGIPLVNVSFSNYDEMLQSMELTGDILGGDAVGIAKKYNDEFSGVLDEVRSKTGSIADSAKPTVMHGNSVYELVLDGTDTIIEAWIEACGGINAVDTSTQGTATATFTLEQIIAWNPDIIITGQPDQVDKILGDANWQSIKAVQNKQVHVNPKGVFGWDRYGVEAMLQLWWASHLFHPDVFADVDIEQKVKGFYKTYLYYDLSDEEVELILAAQPPKSS